MCSSPTYHGIYHNDNMVVFKGNNSLKEIKYWIVEFQQTVYKASEN